MKSIFLDPFSTGWIILFQMTNRIQHHPIDWSIRPCIFQSIAKLSSKIQYQLSLPHDDKIRTDVFSRLTVIQAHDYHYLALNYDNQRPGYPLATFSPTSLTQSIYYQTVKTTKATSSASLLSLKGLKPHQNSTKYIMECQDMVTHSLNFKQTFYRPL